MNLKKYALCSALTSLTAFAHAYDISAWTVTGVGGSSAPVAGEVVQAPPDGPSYAWISTAESTETGLGLAQGNETNGTIAVSPAFSAQAGDILQFNFNFVTSDGAGFADYAWVRLLDAADNEVAILFTARTAPSGDIVPGFGLPSIHPSTTLNPASTPIIGGAPTWSPLGSSSGGCYSTGCGYTGWIQSSFTVAASGSYKLELGVVNWSDTGYDTGLAFSGVTIGGQPITGGDVKPVPLFNPIALFFATAVVGMAGAANLRRRKITGKR